MNYAEKSQMELVNALTSLGYAQLVRKHLPQNVDPEWTIIKGLCCFTENKSIFDITVSLVEHRLYGLINTERLIALSKTQDLRTQILIKYLGHRCDHLDQRFKNLGHLKTEGQFQFSEDELRPYKEQRHIRKWGHDPHFGKLGVNVANFFGEDSRKFFLKKAILNANPWLRLRGLIGPTYRADIVFLMMTGRVTRPQDAAKELGCQRATAYKLWRQIETIPFLDNNPLIAKSKSYY